jgi:hypothetical protein
MNFAVLCARAFSESVSTWFDHDKGIHQIALGVGPQNPFDLLMDRVLSGRKDAEIDDTHTQSPDENQSAEISVARDKDAALLLRRREQIRVVGSRESHLTNSNDVMPQAGQEASRRRVNVLVEQKSHAGIAAM